MLVRVLLCAWLIFVLLHRFPIDTARRRQWEVALRKEGRVFWEEKRARLLFLKDFKKNN